MKQMKQPKKNIQSQNILRHTKKYTFLCWYQTVPISIPRRFIRRNDYTFKSVQFLPSIFFYPHCQRFVPPRH